MSASNKYAEQRSSNVLKMFSIEQVRENTQRAITPLRKPTSKRKRGQQVEKYKGIPHHYYYLIYFMMVDLLEFDHMGPGEKVAYIIPVEHEGIRYCIVYAKFGMKIEYPKGGDPEKVFRCLEKGIRAAKPYYKWRAEQAANSVNLNLISRTRELWDKYQYLRKKSKLLAQEAEDRKQEHTVKETVRGAITIRTVDASSPSLRREARWTGESAIEAFFAWSEHVLVHVAVLLGRVNTAKEIADLVGSDWAQKCKLVFDLTKSDEKEAFDNILNVRRELRNYVAHGSFGKDGAMFNFHSGVGAVPLKIIDKKTQLEFTFGGRASLPNNQIFEYIDAFQDVLWADTRAPAKVYIENDLDLILTLQHDGTYRQAMSSVQSMEELVDHLHHQSDRAINMDF